MMNLWLVLVSLIVLALVFIAWPLWRHRNSAQKLAVEKDTISTRLAENVRIFREHLAELEANLASNAIDQTQFEQLKLELERNLLEDEASIRNSQKSSSQSLGVKVVVGFCVVVLAAGIFFYQQHGGVADVYIQSLQQEKLRQDYQDMVQNRDPNPARAHELITEYEARLKDKPDNLQYLFLLARTQMEIGKFSEAVQAYQRILTLDPQSSMIMAELAQAIFLRDGNKITPTVVDLAKNALTLDPKNTMALGLLGIDAFSRKDYRGAIQHWKKSVDIAGADSQGSRALIAGIEKATQFYVADGGKLEDLSAKSAFAVTLNVTLGSKAKVSPDQAVFIYARAWQGSPMPLAIARLKVKDLPTTIQLDETMAMSPAASLATATDIEVVARVSPSGSAKAEVGDWQAKQGPISMKAVPEQISLEINDVITADVKAP